MFFIVRYLSFCFFLTGIMTNACSRCRRSTPTFDGHDLCPPCRIAAGVCNVDVSNPCLTCLRWNTRTLYRLRKSLVDAKLRAVHRGKQHWSSAFPHLEAWLTSRPASTAASEPGSEVSSMLGSWGRWF